MLSPSIPVGNRDVQKGHVLFNGGLGLCALAILVLAAFSGQEPSMALAAPKALLWKSSEQAMLRVDDRPVVEWGIYQTGKKSNPLLLELGKRHLLVDGQTRQVFELAPDKVTRKGADLYWAPEDRPERGLETGEWLVRDVGLAYRISVRLTGEGRILDLQIPHPMDLRSFH